LVQPNKKRTRQDLWAQLEGGRLKRNLQLVYTDCDKDGTGHIKGRSSSNRFKGGGGGKRRGRGHESTRSRRGEGGVGGKRNGLLEQRGGGNWVEFGSKDEKK